MKKLIYSLILSSTLLISSIVFANTQISFTWDDNPESDKALGYKIYDNLVEISDVPTPGSSISVPDGDHSFTVTCYNVNGESGHTNPVTRTYFTAVPGQPNNFLATDEVVIP